ncbi:globin domain-containing protein [Tateyamaria sp. syn59]|uniref:globin domain-containing protein n=1 Tax=Tateyamaria sp. syn59 TaxID=2576942 RepID=UPI00167AF845|nr:globin domain-containing protein [Tateyamaria sp. syn59]
MDKVDIIRSTWAQAAASPEETARVFYSTLFQIAPQNEPLFRNDLAAQGEKLMETLGFVVDHLDDEDTWIPAAKDLAIRHVAYGVKAEDYDSVGSALIQTFETLMGDTFSTQAKATWIEVYSELSKQMIEAAYPH